MLHVQKFSATILQNTHGSVQLKNSDTSASIQAEYCILFPPHMIVSSVDKTCWISLASFYRWIALWSSPNLYSSESSLESTTCWVWWEKAYQVVYEIWIIEHEWDALLEEFYNETTLSTHKTQHGIFNDQEKFKRSDLFNATSMHFIQAIPIC